MQSAKAAFTRRESLVRNLLRIINSKPAPITPQSDADGGAVGEPSTALHLSNAYDERVSCQQQNIRSFSQSLLEDTIRLDHANGSQVELALVAEKNHKPNFRVQSEMRDEILV